MSKEKTQLFNKIFKLLNESALDVIKFQDGNKFYYTIDMLDGLKSYLYAEKDGEDIIKYNIYACVDVNILKSLVKWPLEYTKKYTRNP